MAEQTSNEQAIFLAALEKQTAAERTAYLDEACGGNAGVRSEVEALLAAHDRLPTAPPPAADLDPPLMFTAPGTVIGRYKILEPIGEGGYGSVFMAEQTSPVHRKVALKIIKAGMDTRQVIARFEAERQALALMDHPNIAKVFDAGVTDTGRPYFVMELVEGTPITKYCDEHKQTPRQRLELFVQVCQAVQHAHQKGIIHRDLKPTNVLVAQYDGKPVPKVIDFGVAKATGQQLTQRTMFTGFGDVIGTPQYMSPEQAELNQLDVDTRSDIYSLGVLLYELLTGSTPLENERIKRVALLEVLRFVREEEPPKPSTRLMTAEQLPSIAASRGLEPKKLSGLVHGELDWIVMRALEKDRARRYETAAGFASDVRRYLNDEAVQACPPSATYRLRKFARRNKPVLTTAVIIGVVLLLATFFSTWQAVRATRAERRAGREARNAKTEAASARAVSNFLNRDLLGQMQGVHGWYDRFDRPTAEVTLAAVVDRAARALDGRFPDEPLVEATLRETLGRTYYSLDNYAAAKSNLERALALRRAHLGEENPATLATAEGLADVTADVELSARVLDIRQRVIGPDDPDTLHAMWTLAIVARERGDTARSIRLFRQTLEAQTRVLGPRHTTTAWSMLSLAETLRHVPGADDREIESLYRNALSVNRDHNQETWNAYDIARRLSEFLQSRQRHEEAEAVIADALLRLKQLPGAPPEMVDILTQRLLSIYGDLGRTDRAAEVRRAWARDRGPSLARAAGEYASLLMTLERFSEAEQPLLTLIELDAKNRIAGDRAYALGEHFRDRRESANAERWFRRALAIRRAVLSDHHVQVADTLYLLALTLRDQDKPADAEPPHREALSIYQKALGNDHLRTAGVTHDLAFLLMRLPDRDVEGEQLFRAALATRRRLVGVGHSSSADTAYRLAQVLGRQKKFQEADTLLNEAYAGLVANKNSSDAQGFLPVLVQWIVEEYRAWSKPEKAAEWEQKLPPRQPNAKGEKSKHDE